MQLNLDLLLIPYLQKKPHSNRTKATQKPYNNHTTNPHPTSEPQVIQNVVLLFLLCNPLGIECSHRWLVQSLRALDSRVQRLFCLLDTTSSSSEHILRPGLTSFSFV
jgi:hypothetical protein